MKFRYLVILFSVISFTFGQYNLNIYTINQDVITSASIISMNSDSVEIVSNGTKVILNISEISQLQFKRTFARGLFTCIGIIAGATIGGIISVHNWEPDVSENPPKFLIELSTRFYISSTIGSVIFGYLGYINTKDIMYNMKNMSHEEKVDILDKLRT